MRFELLVFSVLVIILGTPLAGECTEDRPMITKDNARSFATVMRAYGYADLAKDIEKYREQLVIIEGEERIAVGVEESWVVERMHKQAEMTERGLFRRFAARAVECKLDASLAELMIAGRIADVTVYPNGDWGGGAEEVK